MASSSRGPGHVFPLAESSVGPILSLFLTVSSWDAWTVALLHKLHAELPPLATGGPAGYLVEVMGRGRSDLQMPLRYFKGIHLYLKEKKHSDCLGDCRHGNRSPGFLLWKKTVVKLDLGSAGNHSSWGL